MTRRVPQTWVVKASLASWDFHWNEYLSDDDDSFEWNAECIKSNLCKQFLRDDVEPGDIAVCYQVDDPKCGRAIPALTLFKSVVRTRGEETFALVPHSKAFRLDLPLEIEELRESSCNPDCFQRGPNGRGTIGQIDPAEFDGIVAAMLTYSTRNAEKLRKWLAKSGYRTIRT